MNASERLKRIPRNAPIEFISPRWEPHVLSKTGVIDRPFYELCALSTLRDRLRAGDVWVAGSRQYRAFDEYLLPQPDWQEIREAGPVPVAIETTCTTYLDGRRDNVDHEMKKVAGLLANDQLPDVRLRNGRLLITPLRTAVPPEAEELGRRAYEMLRWVRITDLLVEVDEMTGMSRHFTHLQTGEPLNDPRALYTVLLAEATNLGLAKMAQACPEYTYRQLAWIADWYVRDETCRQALASIINAQHRHPFAGHWGDGTTSSSDAQQFPVGGRSAAIGRVNAHYGPEPGVKLYTHLSDQYGPYHSTTISATASEAPYLVDGLLYHETDLEIAEHYSDTGAFTVTWTPGGRDASGRPSSPPFSAVGEVFMRVRRQRHADGSLSVMLVEDDGEPIAVVSGFLRHLAARDCSPNTLVAYAYDLRHLWLFLADRGLAWQELRPRHALDLLGYLRAVSSRRPRQRLSLAVATRDAAGPTTQLAPGTVNRILAAVSSFYEYALLAGLIETVNPIEQRPDPALARVANRHRPFMGSVSQQRPVRRSVRVKTIQRVPRPLDDGQIEALLKELRSLRDRALILLMLQGGLRPGEALGLHLEDVAYGRRRIVVRHRVDHPKGVRSKSRTERVVDLHEPETLAILSAYVVQERPTEAETPLVFLVGGHGHHRCEPLSYPGLARFFARACERAGIREAWVTPHALRHTHATRMWEGGMRELTLQKRLGHASPESTRLYTRVSDPVVVAEYRRALGHVPAQESRP